MSLRLLLGLCLSLLVPAGPTFAFDGLRITLLGTGGGLGVISERAGPSVLIEAGKEILLFDCGRSVLQRLARAGLAPPRVTHVFLSHLHADNVIGCADLWLTGAHRGREDALRIVGPEGSVQMMQHLEQAYLPDLRSRGLVKKEGARLEVTEIDDNVVYDSQDVRVIAFVLDHGAAIPTYGYRIEAGRRVAVLAGNTRYSDNLIQNAKGASVLVHGIMAADPGLLEASEWIRQEAATHATPEEVAKVFRTARPGLAILSPLELMEVKEDDVMRQVRSRYPGSMELGYDLMVIEIQNEIQLRGKASDRPAGR